MKRNCKNTVYLLILLAALTLCGCRPASGGTAPESDAATIVVTESATMPVLYGETEGN